MSLPLLTLMMIAWSGAVWLIAAGLSRLRPTPHQAQAIWRLAALGLLLPLILSPFMPGWQVERAAPLINEAPGAFIITPDAEPLTGMAGSGFHLPSPGTVLLVVLMIGWAVRLFCWVRGQRRLQRLKRAARASFHRADQWAAALGLPDVPEVRVTSEGAPFAAGIERRSVYIPEALANGPDASAVIAHECVHLKRGDLIARPLERSVADVFWLSPFAWAIRRELDYWREAVVDEEAARLTGDRIAYARALSNAARVCRPSGAMPVAAFILDRKGQLKMRLNTLLNKEETQPGRMALASAAALLLAVPLALAQGQMIKGERASPAPLLAAAPPAAPEAPIYRHPVLDKAKLTSRFGMRRDPFTNEMKFHKGIDLAEEMGKPIYAPADGEVVFSGDKRGYGQLIVLRFADGTEMRFGQLSARKVSEGQTLSAGKVIGKMGKSGRATGPHLHLEVVRDGKTVNPLHEDGLILATHLVDRTKPVEKQKAKAEKCKAPCADP